MVDLSFLQQLQQDDTVKEADTAVRSFIMQRFLRAAEEVAAEHESSMSFSKKKNLSKSSSSTLPRQPRRTHITHSIKSRAQQVPEGFANSATLHSAQQEDIMPRFMSGFSCLGRLKTVLFHARRTVDLASGHSSFRKKSWEPHSLHHMKVANEGTSSISSEIEGPVALEKKARLGDMTKHQNAINTDVPVLHPLMFANCADVKESLRRHATEYHAGFLRSGYPGSDCCTNAGGNPPSQTSQADLAGNQSDKSPHDDYGWARKFATTALKEQEIEIVQKGMSLCNKKQTCGSKSARLSWNHAQNPPPHDVAGENMSRNTSQGYMGGLETNGRKPMNEDDDCDEDGELQFCDALSRLNSVKSNTILGSASKSESCKVLGFEGERINNEMGFTEASSHFVSYKVLGSGGERINNEMDFTEALSHFETSHASMNESNSLSLHVCTGNEMSMHAKMSSLRQRVGRNLKLETDSKQAESPNKHDACAYEQKHECQQAELWTKRISRVRHGSLDSISGLYLSKESTNFPMFPAKCQDNRPNALGWPFGIFSNHSSRVEGSSNDNQQEIDKLAVGGKVPCPPLPPAPTESWLEHTVTRNAFKTSLLASLQQKEKVAFSRRRLKFQSVDLDAERKLDFQSERRWEDVVKGSQVHSGCLRYSEELQNLMQTTL